MFTWLSRVLSFFSPAAITPDKSSNMAPSEIKKWTVSEPWLDIHCALGEAPFYEVATHTLRFVDIKKKQLHTIDLAQGPASLKTLQFDMPVGVTADIEGVDSKKKILVGGKSGIYVLDRESGKAQLLKRFYDSEEKDERLRSNDGAVDPQGRFWIGTMNDFWVGAPQAEGE
jgi:sugar lactone lactonase YvrE